MEYVQYCGGCSVLWKMFITVKDVQCSEVYIITVGDTVEDTISTVENLQITLGEFYWNLITEKAQLLKGHCATPL